MNENCSRWITMPSAIATSTDQETRTSIDDYESNVKSVLTQGESEWVPIWEMCPPWCPGIILNCIPLLGRPLSSPSVTFHKRILSTEALQMEFYYTIHEWRTQLLPGNMPTVRKCNNTGYNTRTVGVPKGLEKARIVFRASWTKHPYVPAIYGSIPPSGIYMCTVCWPACLGELNERD